MANSFFFFFPGMLMVGANAGIVGMTKEHLGLALALSVPVFVVVTKERKMRRI
jgi:GTPase